MEKFKIYQREKGFSESVIRANAGRVQCFTRWSETDLKQIDYNELIRYVAYCQSRGYTTATIQLRLNALRHYCHFLEINQDALFSSIKIKSAPRQLPRNLLEKQELQQIYELQHTKGLIGKRDKVLLGLVVFQAVGSTELEKIELIDLELENGTVYIPSTRKGNSRKLELKPQQLFMMQDYLLNTRSAMLKEFNRSSDKLLVSYGKTERESMQNVIARILQQLKRKNPKIKSLQQIRQSVVTIWVKEHGLRQAQYMSGHRYVSSTERYDVAKLEGLKEEINRCFPL